MDMLLDKGEELGLAQAWPVRRYEATEDLNQKRLKLLNQVKLGQRPVLGAIEELPQLALRSLLLVEGHERAHRRRLALGAHHDGCGGLARCRALLLLLVHFSGGLGRRCRAAAQAGRRGGKGARGGVLIVVAVVIVDGCRA